MTTLLKYHRILLLLCLLLHLPGCASILVATTGDQPLDQNPGRRTLGTMVEDQAIETKIKVNLRKADDAFSEDHLSITSFNGIVLLTGQVRSEALKKQAESIAITIKKVRKVHNELSVAGPTSYVARSNDAWLTTKIKTNMIATKGFPSNRTKVVTESGVVYLMGLLSRAEAEQAINIARQIYGVQRIVKIIEYT